jgi:hypothetical protein
MTLDEHLAALRTVKTFEEYLAHRIAFTEALVKERDERERNTVEWRPFWSWLFYRKKKPPTFAYKIMFRQIDNKWQSVMKD